MPYRRMSLRGYSIGATRLAEMLQTYSRTNMTKQGSAENLMSNLLKLFNNYD